MKTQAHIDETTGEQLAIVYRNHSGECQVRLIPWVLELLRACARKDDTPPAITRHVFYAQRSSSTRRRCARPREGATTAPLDTSASRVRRARCCAHADATTRPEGVR